MTKKVIYDHPRKLPSMYYRHIGEIAARWSMIELHLQEIIWTVLALGPKKGRLLTYWPGAREKIEVFKGLAKQWIRDDSIATEIEDIAKEAHRLNSQRNNFVHGVFGHEPGKPKELKLFYISKTEHKILPRAEHKSAKDIQRVAEELAALQYRLERLHESFKRARRRKGRTPREARPVI